MRVSILALRVLGSKIDVARNLLSTLYNYYLRPDLRLGREISSRA